MNLISHTTVELLHCLAGCPMNMFLYIVVRHRHQSDHECEKLEIPKPRMAATQQLIQDIVGMFRKIILNTIFFDSLGYG